MTAPNTRQTGRLLLAPVAAEAAPSLPALRDYLQHCGFLGAALPEFGAEHFHVGEAFLALITFMGCSPYIELTPQVDGGAFCYIRFDGPWPAPVFRYGRNTQPPRCAACRGRLTDWQVALTAWLKRPLDSQIRCARCDHLQRPIDLGWRREAGFGRLFIGVEDIFPGEAVPVPTLLDGLEKITGGPWHYFYVRE